MWADTMMAKPSSSAAVCMTSQRVIHVPACSSTRAVILAGRASSGQRATFAGTASTSSVDRSTTVVAALRSKSTGRSAEMPTAGFRAVAVAPPALKPPAPKPAELVSGVPSFATTLSHASLTEMELLTLWAAILKHRDSKDAAAVKRVVRDGIVKASHVKSVQAQLDKHMLAVMAVRGDPRRTTAAAGRLAAASGSRLIEIRENKYALFTAGHVDDQGLKCIARSFVSSCEGQASYVQTMKAGAVKLGVVESVRPAGAQINLGQDITGWLPIAQISKAPVADATTLLSPGQKVKVLLLSANRAQEIFLLSTKALEPCPGDMVRHPDIVFQMAEQMGARYRAEKRAKAAQKAESAKAGLGK